MIRKKHITLCFSLFLALSMVLGQLIPVAATDANTEVETTEEQMNEPEPAAEEVPEPEEDGDETGTVPIPDTDIAAENGADEPEPSGDVQEDGTFSGEAPELTMDGEEDRPEDEYTKTFTANKDGASVTVVTHNAGFSDEIHLVVSEIIKDSKDPEVAQKYLEAEEKVGKALEENEDFLAYDLSFKDSNGNEIEPATGAQIEVTLNIQRSKFPENLDEDSVAIQHLEESESGIKVKSVASTSDTVNVEENIVTSSFNVESFSTFTATYAVAKSALPETLDITLEDKITENGRIEAKVSGIPEEVKATYTWYQDGIEVTRVANGIENGQNIYTIDKDPEKATWVNAVAAKGLTSSYQVKVTLETDGQTKDFTSHTLEIEYYDYIRNGNFGTPKFNNYNPNSLFGGQGIQQHNVLGGTEVIWKTTDNDNNIELVGTHKNNTTHYKGNDADGNYQWAELNAERAGSLYQDVITLPGSTLNWSFAHRARGDNPNTPSQNTIDTMYLLITSTKIAEENSLTNQASVKAFVDKVQADPDAYPGITVYEAKDDNRSWKVHSNGYTVPDNQYQTRFYFVAGPTASKGNKADTIGNYIDAVSFGAALPQPVPERSTLYIYKEFGVDSEISLQDFKTNTRPNAPYNALKFRIQYGNVDKVVDVPVYSANSPVYIEQIDYEGDVTVTEVYGSNAENRGSQIPGYDLTTKMWLGDNSSNSVSVNNESGNMKASLVREQNTIVHFENTYKREMTTLTLKKEVNGNMGERNRDFEYYLMLKDEGGNYAKLPENHDWLTEKTDFKNLTTYSFTLSHGEVKTLKLPIGYSVELYKKDVTGEGYSEPMVTYWTNSNETKPTEDNPANLGVTPSENYHKASTVAITEPSTVKIAIKKNADVPSGLDGHDSAIHGLILSAGAGLLLVGVIIALRRRINAI